MLFLRNRYAGWDAGQLLLQPRYSGSQPRQGIVQLLIAQADETQLRIGAAVTAPWELRQGTLEAGAKGAGQKVFLPARA